MCHAPSGEEKEGGETPQAASTQGVPQQHHPMHTPRLLLTALEKEINPFFLVGEEPVSVLLQHADTMVTDTFQDYESKQELMNLCFKAKLYIGATHT